MESFLAQIASAQFSFTGGWIGWILLIAGILLVLGIYLVLSAIAWGTVFGGICATTKKPGEFIWKIFLVGVIVFLFGPGGVLLLGPIYLGPKIDQIFRTYQERAQEKALSAATEPAPKR